MAKRHSAEQWQSWFDGFEQSGQTVAKFCDSIGVSIQSYYKWRRKLMVQDDRVSKAPRSNFVPLVIGTPTVDIELPGGARVRVPNDFDSLRPVLQVLLELGVSQ